MSTNIWDDEEEFRDVPDEVNEEQAPPAQLQRPTRPVAPTQPAPVKVAPEEEVEYEAEEFIEEEEYEDVLADAHLRLEQGSLYKIIMNHDLFNGMDADPKAIQNVQKEIRKFARERMEIMLGMRRETAVVENLSIDFPFNALEVEVIKAMARTFSKGATEHSDRYVPTVTRSTEELPVVPRRAALNPIGGSTSPAKKTQKPVAQQEKPLKSKPATPAKRSKLDATIDQIAREEGVPRELLEEDYITLKKPLHEMSEQEIIERNKQIATRRGTQVKSSSALPMATPEQQEFLAMSRVNQVNQGPGMGKILEAIMKTPVKK